MGTPEFALPSLNMLLIEDYRVAAVVCQPDRPRGRHFRLRPPPVKQLALEHGLPVLQPQSLRTDEFLQQLRQLEPDLIVTAAYGRILPPAVLNLPASGCLNVHASLLPAYRGAAPVNRAIMNGEKLTGVTIMLMDEGLDTGDILAQSGIDISDEANAGQVAEELARLGAEMLPRVIDSWLAGKINPLRQDERKASYAPILKKEDGQIDWSAAAHQVHNHIRGTYPWPGAYTWCGGKRLKVHRARVNTDPDLLAAAAGSEPGTICLCGAMSISVACGSGIIDLLEIQSESGRRMHCRDCAHNYKFEEKMGGRN